MQRQPLPPYTLLGHHGEGAALLCIMWTASPNTQGIHGVTQVHLVRPQTCETLNNARPGGGGDRPDTENPSDGKEYMGCNGLWTRARPTIVFHICAKSNVVVFSGPQHWPGGFY